MENIASAIAIAQTADLIISLLSTEELRDENKVYVKMLKNRLTGNLSSFYLETAFDRSMFLDILDEDYVPNQSTQSNQLTQPISDGIGSQGNDGSRSNTEGSLSNFVNNDTLSGADFLNTGGLM